jgi:murein DD-endopeptidase MepM/ murein hydrolase activator NlpD
VVSEIGDKFPEERMSDPAKFTKPGYAIGLIKELIPKIGWTNAVAGNYVVIDHANGEFSVYCHLQEGSIRVKPGDRVNKAMVIAKVGNTGNSGAPHLHFQLMDSPDFFTANGLPMMFENVPAQVMIAEFPVTGNTLSFSDSIFSRVP